MAKKDGIVALTVKQDPIPLEQITLLDFFAAFASIGAVSLGDAKQTAKQSYAIAQAMLDERANQ
jgi:hypothetical protein